MGELIQLHRPAVEELFSAPKVCSVCCVVDSFGSRLDAEGAARLIVNHVSCPGAVTLIKRRRRLVTGARFDVAVDECDVERAHAVLTIGRSMRTPFRNLERRRRDSDLPRKT